MALTTEMMTTTEVRDQALLNGSMDVAYLDKVLITQRKYFRKFLHNDFYEELLTQIANSTLTTDNNTLLESYIKPALAHYVVYECLPQIRNSIAKGGVYINTSDTSESASGGDFSALRNDYLTKAEDLRLEIDWYIRDVWDDDSTKYPLYCKSESQSGGVIMY